MAKKKRRFRKVYFIAVDNKLYPGDIEFAQAFRLRDIAVKMANHIRRENLLQSEKLWIKKEPIHAYAVEGFYLVHESLFDEILKPFAEEL